MRDLQPRCIGRRSTATAEAVSSTVLIHLADALTVPDGGFSVAIGSWKDMRTGYAVSVFPEHEYCASGLISQEDIERYIRDRAVLLAHPHVVLGGWRSPGDGLVYLDVSVIVPTHDAALTLARAYGQRAVWDFAVCKSISITSDFGFTANKSAGVAEEHQPGERNQP
jgi:hypothetical protein